MSEIRFTVFGIAKTAGSKRPMPIYRKGANGERVFTGKVVAISDSDNESWRSAVADASKKAYPGSLLEGALAVEFIFYRSRPKGHFRSNGTLNPNAPAYPAAIPDTVKLARCAEDALKGVLWRDDSLVCVHVLRKLYGDPRLEVRVQQLPQTAMEAGLVATAPPRALIWPLFDEVGAR